MSELETRQAEFAVAYRITFEEYKKLVTSCSYDEVITCLELLKARRHRSSFRKDMEAGIRKWFSDGVGLKPLSPRQFDASRPKWPVQYSLPR